MVSVRSPVYTLARHQRPPARPGARTATRSRSSNILNRHLYSHGNPYCCRPSMRRRKRCHCTRRGSTSSGRTTAQARSDPAEGA
ncbi:unnamed protein product [Leptidea sinapis]|uniref:Uncharacterized protein n=1 Tax=Leptidea sinapis TaxID=189913 RepID=A0A5E4R0B9_9NEOP|nr:unnamed protein product [Leptidea sinapis]